MKPSHPIGSSTSARVSRGCPKRHFGEYELFPSLIGLSPLPTAHPRAFQRSPVRPSIPCYRDFSLAMGRSQGFASAPTDLTPSSDSPSLRLPPSTGLTSPVTATRRLIMQKARRHPGKPELRPLVGARFQALFHPAARGAFHLSLTVLLRYQSPNVFCLTRWSSQIHPGFLVPRATRDPATKYYLFQLRDCHPLRSTFPDRFVYK